MAEITTGVWSIEPSHILIIFIIWRSRLSWFTNPHSHQRLRWSLSSCPSCHLGKLSRSLSASCCFPIKFSHLSLLMACACLGHGIMRWDDQSSFPFHFLPGCSTDSFKRLSSFYEIMSILQPHWLGKNRTGRTGVDWTQTSVLVSKHSDISGAAAPSQSIDGSHKLEDKWEVNQFSWKELLLMVSWWVHHGDKKCSTTARHWIQTSVLVSKHCDQPGAAVPSQSIDGCHKDEDKWEIPHLKKKNCPAYYIGPCNHTQLC